MAEPKHTIDASGKSLGRVASEAAKILMGKTSADYTPHIRSEVQVSITNASKLHMRESKRGKQFLSYSGFPGGLKRETVQNLASRKGYSAVLRQAITRMLPRNTFRTKRMKNLTISE